MRRDRIGVQMDGQNAPATKVQVHCSPRRIPVLMLNTKFSQMLKEPFGNDLVQLLRLFPAEKT
jgi:hypothetical protein